MIIPYLHNPGNLNLPAFDFEYEPKGVNQIQGILTFTISFEGVAASNPILDHYLNGFGCLDFVHSLMDQLRHPLPMFPLSHRGQGTNALNLTVLVFDLQ